MSGSALQEMRICGNAKAASTSIRVMAGIWCGSVPAAGAAIRGRGVTADTQQLKACQSSPSKFVRLTVALTNRPHDRLNTSPSARAWAPKFSFTFNELAVPLYTLPKSRLLSSFACDTKSRVEVVSPSTGGNHRCHPVNLGT
jgi:hypothetical protein